ncbi:hypothetical protein RhiXN_01427 [Rhizoctonia solani]|uniref:G-protein coupled receptors family 2 profile 2 domain-containing protein n=1 Tax=Rhizoctonia solani TaxID=456999 RepID=A0A8H8T3G4_9AGAM|nr:uncharacterized protein RhiXN_01427 [Rhizoctonia solani]QRW26832.1 hypothetical protein RhiXN_01427 [Rhizoctonia solani]
MSYYDGREWSSLRDYSKPGHRAGLALVGAAGLSSAISTFFLLIYIAWYSIFSKNQEQPIVRGIRSFARSALGVFFICLLLCDFVQGAAFALNFKWAAEGRMYLSRACTAQGAVSQVGDAGAAICAGWIVIIVLPIAGPYLIQDVEKAGYFYGLSGAWCWLGDGYQLERFLYLYMWIFISLGSSLVLYGLVYLRFSGRITFEGGKFAWKNSEKGWGLGCISSSGFRDSSFNLSGQSGSGSNNVRPPDSSEINGVGKHLKTIARRLMLYPLVYSLVTIPVAICRLGVMAGWEPPFGLFIFAGITFSSSGLTNVLLFIATRHSFIQKVATIRPRVHVTTHQVTIMEDARGAQTIHLHDLSTATRVDDLDVDEKDGTSVKSKHSSGGLVGVRFAPK